MNEVGARLRGGRGLAAWCLALNLLAAALLLHRPERWGSEARAVAVALVAAVGGVLGGRGGIRRLVCAVVLLLGLVCLPHALVVGALIAAVGATGVVMAPSWPPLGRRFEGGDRRPEREDDAWTRLDRGEDPTA